MSEKKVILKIYVEGITEQKLFVDALHFWFRTKQINLSTKENENKIEIEFENQGSIQIVRLSKTKASKKQKINTVLEIIKDSLNDNLRNNITYPILRVFDADGEYEKDFKEFTTFKSNLDSKVKDNFDFIIIKNDIEDVILELIKSEIKEWFFNCWSDFNTCLEKDSPKVINQPDKKKLIFTLLDLLGKPSKLEVRNYTDAEVFQWIENNTIHPNITSIKLKLDQYLLKDGKSNN